MSHYLHKNPYATRAVNCLVAFFLLLSICVISTGSSHASTGSYEAALPEELKTAKDMCALIACSEAFPGAKSFSVDYSDYTLALTGQWNYCLID